MFTEQENKIKFALIYFSALALVFNSFSFGAFFNISETASADTNPDMCQVAVDMMLVMDVSGSMSEGQNDTQCDWYELEIVGGSYQCVAYNEEGLTESQCDSKPNTPQCYGAPVFTDATVSKLNSAKEAANSFLDNMGDSDQSGLVSFSDNASLINGLDNNHAGTKTAVNGLTTGGATNIGDAIAFGLNELDQHQNGQAVKAMILLTDGKANKPNGDGNHENATDVQYAIDQAGLAAQKNYKIFTVGLGSNGDINESMLQQIATDTGANYHHAPNGSDLSDIYNDIAWEICQYGSIAGCKYGDLNNNGIIDGNEAGLSGWEITLTGGNNGPQSQQTDVDGCYLFSGLVDGDYEVAETLQTGWVQTHPTSTHEVTISSHNDVTGKHFANYYPTCGNDIVDSGEVCEIGDNEQCETDDGYTGVRICTQDCTGWGDCVSTQDCGDGIVNGGEQCDDGGNVDGDGCSAVCTIEGNTGLLPGDIVINEIMQNPAAVSDFSGEWFELYNASGESHDLQGCVLSDNDGDSHTIGSSLVISSGGYLVLTKNGNSLLNGGINPDYVYSGITLGNGVDEIVLICSSTEVDRVEYDDGATFPDPTGKSMILSDPSLDNNVGSNWCESSSSFGVGDLGTPGSLNDSCGGSPSVCEASISGMKYNGKGDDSIGLPGWTIQLYDAQDSFIRSTTTNSEGEYTFDGLCSGDYFVKEVGQECWEQIFPVEPSNYYSLILDSDSSSLSHKDFSNRYTCADGPEEGGVVINELMWMGSQGQSGGSTSDEWIELFNPTDSEIDLTGCRITESLDDMVGTSQFDGVTISAGGFLVVSNFDKSNSTLDIDPEIVDTGVDLLNNGLIVKLKCGDTVIDQADDGGGLPLAGYQTNGTLTNRSMSRKSPAGDGKIEDSWCDAGTTDNFDAGVTDFGTPGSVNYCKGDEPDLSQIYGHKYEDEDGIATTTKDRVGLEGWQVNLLNSSTQKTATTTTDGNGYYRFEDILNGDYVLSETMQSGWIGMSSTSVDVVISESGTNIIDFINYFEGGSGGNEEYCGDGIKNLEEECDGTDGVVTGYTCSSSCNLEKIGGGGGGGFTSRPDVSLSADFPIEKELGNIFQEFVLVENTGNILLTNGYLEIDFPEDSLEFISSSPNFDVFSTTDQIIRWEIPVLSVDEVRTFEFNVKAFVPGVITSFVDIVFDQASSSMQMVEEIVEGGLGGPFPDIEGPGEVAGDTSGNGGEENLGMGGALEDIPVPELYIEEEANGEVEGEEDLPEVRVWTPELKVACPWWRWVLLIALMICISVLHGMSVRSDENN